MKLLHTSDWHIGQLFYEYDRTLEHQQFLDWLSGLLLQEHIDVLLISGDVFDLSNPAAASIKMFYTFLSRVTNDNPELQIVIIAGNHDSASRLEAPKPLLESSHIHIIGMIEKNEEGAINYNKLVIPLNDRDGNIRAWCMAVPFLRMGDYPSGEERNYTYSEGIAALYQEVYETILGFRNEDQAIITMGHLHTQDAEVTDLDSNERLIMGGVECIPATAFNEGIGYVALGHIHKVQKIGGKENIRYSGSPIPMSFSELNYKHQLIVFETQEGNIINIRSIEVPLCVPLIRIPQKHSLLNEVLSQLQQLPAQDDNQEPAPYLEVRVLLDGPEPSLRHRIETALTGKNVRLARIDVKYPGSAMEGHEADTVTAGILKELQPVDVFSRVYESKYKNPVPDEIMNLFSQVAQEVNQMED